MSNELVTVAILNTPTEASLVRNQLDEEGIQVFLADEEAVGMAWYLGNAIGGVKVQVAEADVERAFEILDEHEPITITEEDWRTDESEDDSDDEDESGDDEAHRDLREANAEEEGESLDEASLAELDNNVNRAYKASLFGLIFFPLQFYALTLLIDLVLSPLPLNESQQKKVMIGFALSTLTIISMMVLFL